GAPSRVTQPLMLSLRPEARFAEVSDHRVVLEAPQVRLPLDDLAPGLLTALKRLASGGAPEDTLADLVLRIDGATALARLDYLLGRLQRLCLINYSLAAGDEMLTVVTPMSGHFQLHPAPSSAGTRVQLSR